MSRILFKPSISLAIAMTLLEASCVRSTRATESSDNDESLCETGDDCSNVPNTTACRTGNCVDANGERVAVDSSISNAVGSDGAEGPDSKTDSSDEDIVEPSDDNGFVDEKDSDGSTAPDATRTDGDTGTGETEAKPVDICDGTDSIRLWYRSDGGFVEHFYNFLQPYGHRALYLDGQCRYWIFENGYGGILTGTLSAQDAENLSIDLRLSQLSELEGRYNDPDCVDGGGSALGDGAASVDCYCRCPDAPAGVADALTNARTWYTVLSNRAEPLAGPIRLIVLSGRNSPPMYGWPLDWNPGLVLVSFSDVESFYTDWDTVGTVIDDPHEIRLLRDLAIQVRNDRGDLPQYPIYVSYDRENDQGTGLYSIIFRDETPPDLRAKIEAL